MSHPSSFRKTLLARSRGRQQCDGRFGGAEELLGSELRSGCFRRLVAAPLGGLRAFVGAIRVADRGLPARVPRRPPVCGEGAQA
jgi:hypothetical protein